MELLKAISNFFKQRYFDIIFFIITLSCLCIFEYINVYTLPTLFTVSTIWLFYFKNKRKSIAPGDMVVITGCDSGLGFSFASHCHKNLNAHVIAGVHNIDSPGANELSKAGIHVHSLELTSSESVQAFVQYIRNDLKNKNLALRCFINNAGIMIFGEFEWQTEEQMRYQVEVNLLGTMRVTKEVLPLLREYSSRLINITSHCAYESLPGVAMYSSTKSALASWTNALRVELKKFGIKVVSFVPGSFVLQSNILCHQQKYFKMMEAAMTPEAKSLYSDYFTRYANYLCSLPCNANAVPKILENSNLYELLEGAMLDQYPQAIYKCEPWRYMIYNFFFKYTSTEIRDWLVEKFVQMPSWKNE
ncbi:SDR family oxidoreductase shroud isoform X2 [Cotesia typhae]|uniref:SDR family oxidoreductase shroud isoform X2 n=1 Tax=Cotesia typhae TaxID=2053667 RepID=UPI003D68E05C